MRHVTVNPRRFRPHPRLISKPCVTSPRPPISPSVPGSVATPSPGGITERIDSSTFLKEVERRKSLKPQRQLTDVPKQDAVTPPVPGVDPPQPHKLPSENTGEMLGQGGVEGCGRMGGYCLGSEGVSFCVGIVEAASECVYRVVSRDATFPQSPLPAPHCTSRLQIITGNYRVTMAHYRQITSIHLAFTVYDAYRYRRFTDKAGLFTAD